MTRPRGALAFLGVLAYLFAGSFVCAQVWVWYGPAGWWVAFVVYAVVGVWLVVLVKRAVWR